MDPPPDDVLAVSLSSFQCASSDVLLIIFKMLEIRELSALLRSCRRFWFLLKQRKFAVVWHFKFLDYYRSTFSPKRRTRGSRDDVVYLDVVRILDRVGFIGLSRRESHGRCSRDCVCNNVITVMDNLTSLLYQ
jgi:hypothetical protein